MTATMETAVNGMTIRFAQHLPGLPERDTFTLTEVSAGLFTLVSDGPDPVRLFVVDPAQFVSGYTPTIDAGSLEPVGVRSDEAGLILTVVHPPVGEDGPTVNLLAPIVVNRNTGAALQVILDGDWDLRAPLG